MNLLGWISVCMHGVHWNISGKIFRWELVQSE